MWAEKNTLCSTEKMEAIPHRTDKREQKRHTIPR